jgi:hypothetical protein
VHPKVRSSFTLRQRLLAAYLRQLITEEGICLETLSPVDAMRLDFLVQGDVASLITDTAWARDFTHVPN